MTRSFQLCRPDRRRFFPRHPRWLLTLAAAATLAGAATGVTQDRDAHWPQYRGWQAAGVAEGYRLPVEWDIASGKNVAWKVAVPGLGHSSPVIWGDRLFLTTAIREQGDDPPPRLGIYGDGDEVNDDASRIWKLLCYDKKSGKLLWERELHRGVPRMKHHVKASHANATVAANADRLVVFLGSEGLFCLDHEGKVRWKKDYGAIKAGPFQDPALSWGFANSPVIHEDKVVVLADHLGGGFLSVVRLDDGGQVWRVRRDENTTWGAPLVARAAGRTQIVVNGFRHAGGYEFDSGKEIWKISGGGDIPTPTPIYGKGMFYLTNYHGPMAPVYAVKADSTGAGVISPNEAKGVAWIANRVGSYMQTPLLLGDLLYVPRWRGSLVCLRPESGEVVYEERLGVGAFTSSPVAGDGKIYIASEEGEVYVVGPGEKFRVLAKNEFHEPTLASPAISEGVIYYRTSESLIALKSLD